MGNAGTWRVSCHASLTAALSECRRTSHEHLRQRASRQGVRAGICRVDPSQVSSLRSVLRCRRILRGNTNTYVCYLLRAAASQFDREIVAPASCRLSRASLALGAASEDALRTAAGTAALRSVNAMKIFSWGL